jgi:hypothetical protein
MAVMQARRRTAGIAVLALLACALAGAVASAASLPGHCCPESERSAAAPSPCTSLVPTPCCGAPLASQPAPSLSPAPAALAAPAAAPAPALASARARGAAARAVPDAIRAPRVLRL